MRSYIVTFLALTVGIGLGAWFMRSSPSSATPNTTVSVLANHQETASVNPVIVHGPTVDPEALKQAVREAVREEMARGNAEKKATVEEADDKKQEERVEITTKIDEAHQFIERAALSGRWGQDQAQKIREMGANLSGEDYLQMVRPLIQAINAGRVTVDMQGLPY